MSHSVFLPQSLSVCLLKHTHTLCLLSGSLQLIKQELISRLSFVSTTSDCDLGAVPVDDPDALSTFQSQYFKNVGSNSTTGGARESESEGKREREKERES